MVLILCLNFTQDDEQDALIRSFTDLKDILNQIADLRELDPNHFLGMSALNYFFLNQLLLLSLLPSGM